MTKHTIERGLQVESIYNIDEIGFGQKIMTKKVIYLQRSISLWGTSVEDSFRITIFACVSASNRVVAPC